MYLRILPLFTSVHRVCVWCLQRPEDSIRSLVIRATNGCVPPCGFWGLKLSSLEEQPLLLAWPLSNLSNSLCVYIWDSHVAYADLIWRWHWTSNSAPTSQCWNHRYCYHFRIMWCWGLNPDRALYMQGKHCHHSQLLHFYIFLFSFCTCMWTIYSSFETPSLLLILYFPRQFYIYFYVIYICIYMLYVYMCIYTHI